MLRSNEGYSRLPRRAPQVLLGLARRGAAWMPRGDRRAGSPLYRPPTKPRRADRAAIEPPFLWILSKGCAKESISPSGANTRLTHRRDSDLIICFFINRCDCVTSAHNTFTVSSAYPPYKSHF